MSVSGEQGSFSKVVSWKQNHCADILSAPLAFDGGVCVDNTIGGVASSCDVSSLRTSSGFSSDVVEQVKAKVEAPPDVLAHFEVMLSNGVSVDKTVELVEGMFACYMGYLRCQSGDVDVVVPRVDTVSVVSSSSSGSTTKRALRRQRNKDYGVALAEADGFCYLRPLRRDRRKLFHRTLGPSPTWWDFVKGLTQQDLDMPRANSCLVYKMSVPGVTNAYHVAHPGEVCEGEVVGTFVEVLFSLQGVLGLSVLPGVTSMAPLVVPIGVVSGKVQCDECGFLVNPVNHVSRCKVQSVGRLEHHVQNRQVWDCVEKLARFGDMVHKWDVNVALRAQGVDWPEVESRSQEYISAEAQTAYMSQLGASVPRFSSDGHSPRKISSSFEASYLIALFRDVYLHAKFPHQLDVVQSSGAGNLDCTAVVGDIVGDISGRLVIVHEDAVCHVGYCYLMIINSTCRSAVSLRLGSSPTFGQVLRGLRPAEVDMNQVAKVRIYRVGDGLYHMSDRLDSEGVCVGTVGQVVGAMLYMHPGIAVAGMPIAKCKADSCLSLDDKVGVPLRGIASVLLATCAGSRHCTSVGFGLDPGLVEGQMCQFKDLHMLKMCLENKAWLGDVQHRMDVRMFLLLEGVPREALGEREEQYVHRDSQTAWYLAYQGSKELVLGTNNHSVSTAFEASYYGAFRDSYLLDQLHFRGKVFPWYACFFYNYM